MVKRQAWVEIEMQELSKLTTAPSMVPDFAAVSVNATSYFRSSKLALIVLGISFHTLPSCARHNAYQGMEPDSELRLMFASRAIKLGHYRIMGEFPVNWIESRHKQATASGAPNDGQRSRIGYFGEVSYFFHGTRYYRGLREACATLVVEIQRCTTSDCGLGGMRLVREGVFENINVFPSDSSMAKHNVSFWTAHQIKKSSIIVACGGNYYCDNSKKHWTALMRKCRRIKISAISDKPIQRGTHK